MEKLEELYSDVPLALTIENEETKHMYELGKIIAV